MGGTIKEEILQKLPENIREKAKVTMSYQTYLQGINSNLKTVYGEYADWEKCIEKYFESEQYTAMVLCQDLVQVKMRFSSS